VPGKREAAGRQQGQRQGCGKRRANDHRRMIPPCWNR
jgi:hypothetical protein